MKLLVFSQLYKRIVSFHLGMASRISLCFVLYFVIGDVFLASLGMYLASNLLSQLTITDHLILIAAVEVAREIQPEDK